MSKTRISNGKRGGLLEGKPHYDKNGNSLGGIKAVVTDAGGKPVELEGGEVIINKEASKKYWKELSKINQSAGNGVPILPPDGAVMDEDPEEFKDGGNIIEFNPNHLPNKWITEYAESIKKNHPEIWKKGGNIFGNEAFNNLLRVRKRGYWLDSEEWMYIKWRSYVARHKKDFRIEGVVAMLKWCDTVDKGWAYMKNLIKTEIAKSEKKTEKMARGGNTKSEPNSCQILDKNGNPAIDDKSLRKMEKCILKLPQTKDLNLTANGKYKIPRKKLHKKIIDEFKKNAVCITKGQPIAILMGGSPASGKSSFLKKYRPFLLQDEILKVDADEIRAKLPEYKGYNATQTHQETKDIVNTLISDRNIGVPCDFDLIYDGTMNNVRSYKPLIELLRSRNYKIFIVYMDKVPKDVIMQRMKDRYLKTGRFVPAEVVDDFFQKGKSAFEELKPLVDGYMVVDGSNQEYDIIERGGMQLPKDRAYSKLGEKISPKELEKIEYKDGGKIDKKDSVELDIPLMIRIMELAREDIKSDKELHDVAERLIEIRDKGVLTMEDYDFITNLKKKSSYQSLEKKFKDGGDIESTKEKINDLLTKAQIPYQYTVSHKNGSSYWTINSLPYRIADHDKPKSMDVFERYKVGENDFRSYEEFLNFLIKNFDLTDLTKEEEEYKKSVSGKIKVNEDGLYVTPDGLKWDAIENALNYLWRWKLEERNIYKKSSYLYEQEEENRNSGFYADGGLIELLAPNGKPSNLTPEQYKLVRTPEFKAWFGDWENDPENASKVVDENGEPLVVYNRGKVSFNVFDSSKQLNGWLGKGFYFSESKNEFKKYGNKLIVAFLNVKKPFVVKGESPTDFLYEIKKELNSDDSDTTQLLKNNNFDGVIYKHWDYESRMFTCFEPNQIKLADGTNTTFDGNNPDIRFETGGTVLLSPNGKPSNLTPEQYKLVRTPEFKAWFGDWENDPENASKVVDENGEPLVVFHGSSEKFYTFDKKKIGQNYIESQRGGFFFTQKIKTAENYATLHSENKSKGFVYECFLNIKSPIIRRTNSDYYNPIDNYDINRGEYIRELSINNKLSGIIIYGTRQDNLYVVRNSNQIKLADGTNTTFDGKNPDIRFETGGTIDLASFNKNSKTELKKWDYEHLKTKDEKRKAITHLYAKEYYAKNNIIPLAEPDNEGSIYWQSVSLNDKEYNISFHLYFHDFDNPLKITEANVTFYDEDYNELDSSDIQYKRGGRTVAQTPAPKKDQVYGSQRNAPKSSKDSVSAEEITFDARTLETIENKVREHNEDNPTVKITVATAKAVVRRGMGAYSKSHRPTISGGQPNSRVAWGLARLNAFLYKAVNGRSKSGKYSQDNDLLEELGIAYEKFENGGNMSSDDKVMKAKELLQNSFDYLEDDLELLGKGANGMAFLTVINNEMWVAKYTRSITEFWLSQMAMVSNPPHVVTIKDVKKLSENFEYGIIHKYTDNDGVPNKAVWNVAIGIKFKEYLEEQKSVPPKEKEYVRNLAIKLTKEVQDYFEGITIDTSNANWGYEDGKLVLFDIDGNVKKSQFEEWMKKYSVNNTKMATGGLIAPNGNPTKLTPEQYKLVRTPEFKAWFGDWENDPENASKVVDENGEPLVVYHGSRNKFNQFRTKNQWIKYKDEFGKNQKFFWSTDGSLGEGAYFTNDKDTSLQYTGGSYGEIGENGFLYEVFLNLKKPSKGKIINKKINDGVIGVGGESGIYMAINPNQIKLADGTNTTFDGSNPDIRYKDGGKIKGVTEVVYEDNGDTILIGSKNNKTRVSVKGLSLEQIKEELEFEKDMLRFKKSSVANFSENEIRSQRGMTDKEKLDAIKLNKQSLVEIEKVEKIIIPFYESKLNSFKDGGSIDNERIDCHKCDWSWKVEDGGDDLYVCHKCGYDNAPYYATKFAGGGGIDINEPFNVNGKTLAERVRILLKQLYPDYKWSVTSSYNKLDVYLLEADFDPFTDLFKEQHPDRKYYNINNWDFSEYNRENKAQVTDRALEVFKPIREYIDKFVYNRNANDPYADYSDYNIYEYTYIGKWDKPYVQVAPKAGKRAKTPSTPKVAPTPISPEPKFKVGDIITYRSTGDKKYKVIGFIEFDKEIQENVYRIESLSDKTKGKAKESMMSLIEQKNLDNVFTIQNIVSKTQWSDGLKQAMIQDFVNSGYENVTPLIGSDMRETSKNIEKKVDGFASEKNTYLQANYLADMIHILISQGNVPTPSEPPAEQDSFLEYLKSNNEKATFIPRELEMMNALTLFIQSAKDIEGLDADRYANLLANMIGKLTPTK